jgi:glutamyl-tRNA synthetase
MKNQSKPRVRFAPSPTGYLHVGGARTALFNWLFAKATGGTFLLRIEDTDRTRYNEVALRDLLVDLKWLGLNWDEGVEVGGPCGPYQQSERLDLYHQHVMTLVEKGLAYPCFCTSQRLEDVRKEQELQKLDLGYDRHCRDLDPNEARLRMEKGEPYVIRLKVPLDGVTVFEDLLRGKIEMQNALQDDLVLLKTDGFPTYHLASVVDDHAMEVTHVLRGDEWITSTPKHVMLYLAFGWEMPVFCHLPVILAAGGGKLSKRKGAVAVGEYRKMGYTSQALFNFLALLGWNPGDDREKMTLTEMIQAFALERISAKSAVFDEKKLLWLNGQYLGQTPALELLPLVREVWDEHKILYTQYSEEYQLAVIGAVQERCKILPDFAPMAGYFFSDPTSYDEKAVSKHFNQESVTLLSALLNALANADEFHHDAIEKLFHEVVAKQDVKLAALIHPVRLGVSGVAGGPSLYVLLELLGKETIVRRLQKTIDLINGSL